MKFYKNIQLCKQIAISARNHHIRTFCHSSQYLKSVRIGCASGFWGDSAVSAPQLINHGRLDFLVFDYLSEITMSLLSAAQQKAPEFGYAPDFVQVAIAPYLTSIKKQGIRVISNAGGINPHACATALAEAAKKAGVDLSIAVVTGDNISSQASDLRAQNTRDMFNGQPLPEKVTSMTAYLGAGPIKAALDRGADIVVTGRCTDSALVLGPLVHTYGWSWEDYNTLAMGSLAGHIIECGAQATGGIHTDWQKVPDWHNIGFPIVDCEADGSFVVTKPERTGGLVSPATVAEQMLYEIGDPRNYVLPDVVCDFSGVKVEQVEGAENAVQVSGARGKRCPDDYKVCATYMDGYRLTAVCTVAGPRAADKGRRTADAIVRRVRGIHKLLRLEEFRDVHVQVLGAEDSYGPHATEGARSSREAVVWIAAHHNDKRALQLLAREIAPAGTGMAPGLCGIVGGRPKVSPILRLFSFLHPKSAFDINITMNNEEVPYASPDLPSSSDSSSSSDISSDSSSESSSESESDTEEVALETGSHSFRLEDLAYTRSGDKGNNCNIGVIARHPSFVPYLRAALTPEAVADYMAHVFEDTEGPVSQRVLRYEVPGVHGFNFVLLNSLGGGGVASLRSDPQGKAFGQMLLDFEVDNVPDLPASAV